MPLGQYLSLDPYSNTPKLTSYDKVRQLRFSGAIPGETRIGCVRISTAEGRQVLHHQIDALKAVVYDRTFEDRGLSAASIGGRDFAACLENLRSGDTQSMQGRNRLGGLAGELIALIDGRDVRGVGFRALYSQMDTTTPAGCAFLQIRAAFAAMERNFIRRRVREGLKAARVRLSSDNCSYEVLGSVSGRSGGVSGGKLAARRRRAGGYCMARQWCALLQVRRKGNSAQGSDGRRERSEILAPSNEFPYCLS